MAPGTNLGAATPVQIGAPGAPEKPQGKDGKPVASEEDTLKRKQVNDAAAYIRGLAQLRGRNAEWAERAVREAVSLSAEEAVKQKVVDLQAGDLDQLLRAIDGRKVQVAGQALSIHSAGLAWVEHQPDWRTRLLAVITDPSVALLLLMIGVYGLIFEFANPGLALPGVLGGICLLLGLYAMQLLPVNYAGVALIVLGLAFMAAEAFVPSFGALGLGGIAAFVIGSVMLIDTDMPGYGLPWMLIVPVAVASALFSFFVASMALRARRRPVVTGAEELVGATGVTLEDIEHEGWARVHSEHWRVCSKTPLPRGSAIRVRARHDLILDVEPWQGE